MNLKYTFALLVLSLLVSACGASTPTPTPTIIVAETPLPVETITYPAPVDTTGTGYVPWYPAPGTPGAPAEGAIMTTGYEPQPYDVNYQRGEIFIELDSSQLIIMESYPIQVMAVISGNLPDPCHLLRVVVTAANADNRIALEVYSLTDPSNACATVLQPFSATIPLGTYSDGHFSVYVNGELLGEFDS